MPAWRGRAGSRPPSQARGASRAASSPKEAAGPQNDDDYQRLERPFQSDRRADRIADGDETARRAGESRADGKSEEISAAHIDAGEEGGLPVLGRCPNGLAPSPVGEQELKPADEDEGDGQAQETDHWDREASNRDDGAAVRRDDGPLVRGPELDRESVQHQRQAEANQQRVLDPCLLRSADDEAEERAVEAEAEEQRERDHEEERGKGGDPEQGDDPERPVASQHDQLAVGDVEHLQDAKDEREADRGQPVEPAEQDPENDLLGEGAHVAALTLTALGGSCARRERAQIGLTDVRVAEQIGAATLGDDAAGLEQVGALGQGERGPHVLLDQKYR